MPAGALMYPGEQARLRPDQAAFVMASSGEIVTYAELDARSSKLAHYFRLEQLGRLDHYAIFLENHPRFIECCAAGERSGLYFTCINSHLTAQEVAYILNNSRARLLITSADKLDVVRAALAMAPQVTRCIVIDGADENDVIRGYADALAGLPSSPIADEALGTAMLYSSGTTGQPKGILRPLPPVPPCENLPVFTFFQELLKCRAEMIYLSPAPLYHSAPNTAVGITIRSGGTAIIMERFDPEQYLAIIEKYRVTHTQLVPTMFSRMLKLPEHIRLKYDLSSLEYVVHAAAPCPPAIKQRMIDWWGSIIHEYYGATESIGFATCDSAEWLAHRGTVGKIVFGELNILDDDLKLLPSEVPGTIWFKPASPFAYFGDPARTAEAYSPDGTLCTVGDIGYVDDDGFLYLTDRKAFMIIAGGVNIYPQECENLLISHPKVMDAAVFGVPNPDFGEEVKAVVQPLPQFADDAGLADELTAFCMEHLARYKCPRSIDFMAELPRLPTGKLYKRLLQDRYRQLDRSEA